MIRNFQQRCLAVSAALLIPAVMSGCSSSNNQGSTSTSTTGGISSQINAPTGTVMGVVQDTNGNPIAGAMVYLGGTTATTNAGGQYTFTNVAVTNTANLNGTIEQKLIVSIIPQAGYLGAYVTVTPAAQIDGISTDSYSLGGNTNPVTTFISGYTAQAGTAVLPQLQATVSGVLRDSNTGALLPNTTIGLDFTGVLNTGGLSAQNGVTTTYSTQPFTATSDAQGAFSIANVPNDSSLNVVTSGFTVSPAVLVDTSAGALGVDLGDVTMNPVTSADNVQPTFTTVTELANTNMLKSGIDGTAGITLQFSEAIKAKANGSYLVQVVNKDTGALLASTTTLAADGKSAKVTTTAAIAVGTNVDINLLTADFQDLAGNTIIASAVPVTNSVVTATSGAQYLRLSLVSWKDALVGAAAVTASAQGKTDNSGSNDLAALQALNPAFNDVWDADNLASDFQGLNSAANATGLLNDARKRLSALATAIQGKAVNVVSNQAIFSFTPSNATSYVISVNNGLTVDVISGNTSALAAVVALVPGFTSQSFTTTDALPVAVIIGNAKPGDAVTITPLDDLGYQGTAVTTVLADNVEPTTVLQQSYGLATAQPAAVVPFGQGGQLASANASLVGTPFLTLTAGLLDKQNPAANSLVEELFALNGLDANGNTAIASPANPNIYDATAYTAMNKTRTVGISMSENIAMTATMPTFTGAQALTGWAANNDVLVDDNGTVVNEDLVNFDVADIFAMSNQGQGKIIDLSNAIQDTATTANVGTVAKVVVQDKLPPMVTSAFYNGSDITVNFNEAINPAVGDVAIIGATAITLSQATIDAFNQSGVNTKLVIGSADWGNNLGLLATFALPSYGNADHAPFDFKNIQDVNGNAWGVFGSAGIATPKFALATGVGVSKTFTSAAPVATGFAFAAGAVSTAFSVDYVFSQPINLTTAFGAASPTTLTSLEVGAKFTLVSAALINTAVAATSASLSADGKTLTVNISTTAGVATNDTLSLTNPGLLGAFTSTYDNAQKVLFTTPVLTVTAL